MGNICLNDLFAFCTGEPKATNITKEFQVVPGYSNNNSGIEVKTCPACRLDIKTCGKYQTNSEHSAGKDFNNLDNSYRHVLKAEKKPKAKSKRKVESDA